MAFSLLLPVLIFVGIYSFHFSKANEPLCSKFPYEEQLLEKMIRTELKVETMVNEIKTTQDNVLSTLGEIKQTVAEFSDKFVDLRKNSTEQVLTYGDLMKAKEELFAKRFEETEENLTKVVDDQRKSLIQFQELFAKRFEETKENLTNVVDDQRKSLMQLQGKLERPSIAFHAHHVTDLKLDTTDEVIIFDKTFYNEGTGYDTATGIFRAPVGGLYQFIVHVCAITAKYTFIGIVLEGKVIAADANYDKVYSTCNSVAAIVRVKSGEQVWVKSTSSGSTCQLSDDVYRMNTFSGILVNN